MDVRATVKHGVRILSGHPEIVGWYLRNRVYLRSLARQRSQTDGVVLVPRGLTFKPTLACNLRCKMCSFAASGAVCSNPNDSLPLEAWMAVVDDVAPHHTYVTITGGEPLLYPHIAELIRYIKKRRLFCTLTTNGTLLAKKAPLFMDSPPDVMVVSLDGPPDVHNEIRSQPRVFERAADGIRVVQELRRERRQRNPLFVINCAITPHSFRHVEEMLEVAHELGAAVLNYQHQWSLTQHTVDHHNRLHGGVHPVSCQDLGGFDPPPVDPAEVVEVVRRIRQNAHRNNGRTMVAFHPDLTDAEVHEWYANPQKWIRRQQPTCAWMNTDILPNGEVEPCLGLICGNVTQEPMTKIWNNAAFRAHRQRLTEAGDVPLCVRCCAFFRRD